MTDKAIIKHLMTENTRLAKIVEQLTKPVIQQTLSPEAVREMTTPFAEDKVGLEDFLRRIPRDV